MGGESFAICLCDVLMFFKNGWNVVRENLLCNLLNIYVMHNVDKTINDVLIYITKNPVAKIVAYPIAAYFIYQAGKAAGEFIYYITR
jgi:hypothetical protein